MDEDDSTKPPWSELPEELLAAIYARIFYPNNCAHFQAMCRSWRSAARPPSRQLPWIMLPLGGFMDTSNRVLRRLTSFPEIAAGSTDDDYYHRRLFSFLKTTKCIGSTDGWIAVDCADRTRNRHKYLLHNVLSSTTLPLPKLDAAIGHVSKRFHIHKVLMRSTPDDVIALMTNHRACPIILTRRGKGVWLPDQHAGPLTLIIDVAFIQDRLYGITLDEDLVFLDIASDDNGIPVVTGGEVVIGEKFHFWVDDDEEAHGDDDDGDGDDDDDGDGDDDDSGDDDSTDCEDGYENDDVVASDDDDTDNDHHDQDQGGDRSDCEDEYTNSGSDDDDDDDDDDTGDDGDDDNGGDDDDDHNEREHSDEHAYDWTRMTKKDEIIEATKFLDVDESPDEHDIEIRLYLIESRGKLLMVRQQVLSSDELLDDMTHKVDVFEADISGAMWLPVRDEIGGQALFVSRPFCKSVSAACSQEIQKDSIYFVDTDDVFDMRSQTVSSPRNNWDYTMTLKNIGLGKLTWVFPPELVA